MTRLSAVPLRIVACGAGPEPVLLETALGVLAEYAAAAPQWRLERWSFAATAAGSVLVRGLPLPPLPGTAWVDCGGIAVPAGCAWTPAVEPAVVRQLLHLAAGELGLLRPDGRFDRISAEDWVRAGRSAIRETCAALRPGTLRRGNLPP
jgi:hypothetical protein